MGFFDHIQKKGSTAIKPQPAHIRKEVVTRKALIPTPQRSNTRHPPGILQARSNGSANVDILKPHRQNPRKRPSPAQLPFESNSEDSDIDEALHMLRKKSRLAIHPEHDLKRRMRCTEAFSNDDDGIFQMIHAREIASLSKPLKYKAAFSKYPNVMEIELQYPSNSQKEKYQAVAPIQSDDFTALEDIREVIEVIIDNYLPTSKVEALKDDSSGLLRRLKRATDRCAGSDYIVLIQEWNGILARLIKDRTIGRVLDNMKCLDLRLIERILTQTYSRTVSPRVGLLRQYENGTDNVYGELLPKFISDILKKDTRLKSDQVFVDLGSGVGNVVLQAALEVGCESWGCEVMENACDLAELQEKEFRARCRLWGLAAGDVHLERGDFLENAAIAQVLQRADLVLVNNQAFTPELNEGLISLFLDLKEGCQIVSLKSFVPNGHKITSRNQDRASNVLDVVEKRYYSACVSWTDAPGTYYVSMKDSTKLRSFINEST